MRNIQSEDDNSQRLLSPQNQSDNDSSKQASSSAAAANQSFMQRLKQQEPYALYVLVMLMFIYLMNQLDRYALAVTSKEIEAALNFSDSEYQILAGLTFTLIYTTAGIPIGFLADRANRRNILLTCLIIWSLATAAMGLAQNYWQLSIARFVQGFGEAGCTPLAAGIIADYFGKEFRSTALAFYNWGIYTGYSLAYGLGNALKGSIGYRTVYYAFGLAGIPLAILGFLTIREPQRGAKEDGPKKPNEPVVKYTLKEVLVYFASRPSLMLLCFAGAVRNAAGYVWAYNTNPFFEDVRHLSSTDIAKYMGWIPLVSGCLGVLFGGFISDKLTKERGITARVSVLIFSQLFAAPFAAGALYLPVPYAFISLIPTSMIGEMWVGVTLTVVAEVVPPGMRVLVTSVYFFIISNIAGLAPLLVTPLQHQVSLQGALLILYPGLYVAASFLFMLTLSVLKRDIIRAQEIAEGERRRLLVPENQQKQLDFVGKDSEDA